MVKRQSIQFIEAKKPIREPVTKVGGQPVWIEEAQWPVSASTGRPMRFICQIAIAPEVFGSIPPKVAYIFMTDEEEYVDRTWEPDGGENAVVLQPGVVSFPVRTLDSGPILYRMVKKMFKKLLVPEQCEFAIKINESEDHDFVAEELIEEGSEEKWGEYADALYGNKVGGTPIFLQNTEFPGPGSWRLLLQLDSGDVPFSINFGDVGIGYAFLSEDGMIGKFLWQCA